jgi:hypothetical protein
MPFRCKREAVSLADIANVADFLYFFFCRFRNYQYLCNRSVSQFTKTETINNIKQYDYEKDSFISGVPHDGRHAECIGRYSADSIAPSR